MAKLAVVIRYDTLRRQHSKLLNRLKYSSENRTNTRLDVLLRMGFREHAYYKIRKTDKLPKQLIDEEYWHLRLKYNKIVYFTDSIYLYLYYQ